MTQALNLVTHLQSIGFQRIVQRSRNSAQTIYPEVSLGHKSRSGVYQSPLTKCGPELRLFTTRAIAKQETGFSMRDFTAIVYLRPLVTPSDSRRQQNDWNGTELIVGLLREQSYRRTSFRRIRPPLKRKDGGPSTRLSGWPYGQQPERARKDLVATCANLGHLDHIKKGDPSARSYG